MAAPPKWARLSWLVFAATAGMPGLARADNTKNVASQWMSQSTYLTGGPALSIPLSDGALAYGAEVTLTHYPWWRPRDGDDRGSPIGFGAFARALREGGDHLRLVVGPQMNITFFTFELGYSFRGANDVARSTHALHVAPGISFGIASIEFAWTFAFAGESPRYGNDATIAIALKFPLALGEASVGEFLWYGPGH